MSLADKMLAAFEGSRVAHGTTTVGRVGRNGKADAESKIVRQPLDKSLMQGHINGGQGVGAIPINEDNKCRWGALDIDIYDLDQSALQKRIQKLGFPLLHCRSKSGGAHLYLFLQEYEQAKVVREYLLEMAVALGHSGCEIFPKQDKILSERGDVGNFLNLPYHNAELPQRYCFNENVESIELSDFLLKIEEKRCTINHLETLRVKKPRKYFKDGPPCLQHLFTDGATSEDRNKKLFMIGVYCRLKFGDDWKSEMETFNHALFSTPLDAKEVLDLQKSLERKEYFYTCEQEPFKSFCDKEMCSAAKFGIGDAAVEAPVMGNLQIILSEPRLYFLTVGGNRIQLNTEQLHNQSLFQRACIEQASIAPPQVRPAKWTSMLQAWLNEGTKQEVPEELTITGEFKALLREHCTSRIRALHPEEMLSGKPFATNEGITLFTMSGIMEFLTNRRFNSFTRAQVGDQLKKLNGNRECHGHKSITKEDGTRTTTRVWWVPSFENEEVFLPVKEIKNDIPF
jgi:hypothetical protein